MNVLTTQTFPLNRRSDKSLTDGFDSGLSAICDRQFFHNMSHVRFYCFETNEKTIGHFLVVKSFYKQVEHFQFTFSKTQSYGPRVRILT